MIDVANLSEVGIEVAAEIVRTHEQMLRNGEEVTVATLLRAVDRCPACAAPLLIGDTTARCTNCETAC